jgi:hypothetical protein
MSDAGFLLAALTAALGTLTLFAVVALAGALDFALGLLFLALPLALFAAAALLLWQEATAEAESVAGREAAQELARRDNRQRLRDRSFVPLSARVVNLKSGQAAR